MSELKIFKESIDRTARKKNGELGWAGFLFTADVTILAASTIMAPATGGLSLFASVYSGLRLVIDGKKVVDGAFEKSDLSAKTQAYIEEAKILNDNLSAIEMEAARRGIAL